MAQLQIPMDPTQPDHTFLVDLEQVVYLFHFKENSRSGRWTLDICQEDGTPIAQGIPIVVNWNLLAQHKDPLLPPGELYCIDMTGSNREPTTEDFGVTHLIVYEESSG